MCVIIALGADQTVPFGRLRNAVLNNPHGFGIVTTDRGKLSVFKKFKEEGNDPEQVAKELDKRAKAEMRYLHLRYRTRGSNSKENTHPFTVFKRDGHHIEFMHNGTLTKNVNFSDTEKSDTRQFAENFLVPVLSKWHGEKGPADIEDPHLESWLESFFGYNNRGLLISNKLDPLFLGKWDVISDVDGAKIAVSNTDYFNSSISNRMTDFYKPKTSDIPAIIHRSAQTNRNIHTSNKESEEDKEETFFPLGTAVTKPVAEIAAPTTTNTVSTTPASTTNLPAKKEFMGRTIVPMKEVDLKQVGRFLNATDLEDLFDTQGDQLDDELITLIANLTYDEYHNYVNSNPIGAAHLLEHLFIRCVVLIDDNERLEEKHLRATQMIASLRQGHA